MATRVYPASVIESHPLPAFSAYWDSSVGAVRRRLEVSKLSQSATATPGITKAVAGPYNWCIVMLVLPALQAQTISGNLKGQFLMNESVGAMDAGVQCSAKLWRPSTGAYVGTLLANNNYGAISATPGNVAYELATTLTNHKVPGGWTAPGTALTSQTAVEDDCLVVELGVRFFEAAVTSRVAQVRLHQNQGTDLPEDETTTTSNDPWLEFSQTLLFKNKADVPPRRTATILTPSPLVAGQLWPRGAGG